MAWCNDIEMVLLCEHQITSFSVRYNVTKRILYTKYELNDFFPIYMLYPTLYFPILCLLMPLTF